MRLPEAKIKDALLHPHKLVRQEALMYFAEGRSPDPGVMPQVIKAFETFGPNEAFRYLYFVAMLTQTEETVDWMIRELHAEKADEEYFAVLANALCDADARLIAPRAQDIINAPRLPRGSHADVIREQEEMAKWEVERCWSELERFCKQAAATSYDDDFDWREGERIVATLARRPETSAARVLELLRREFGHDDESTWMESLAVDLAGRMRLKEAVEPIAAKMPQLNEIVVGECIDALAAIGGDGAAEAVRAVWSEIDLDFTDYAVTTLGKVRSDASVRICRELLERERDRSLKTQLADSLLRQLAAESIEPVRRLVLTNDYDSGYANLKMHLVTVATMMEETFPEYAAWERETARQFIRQEKEQRERWGWLQRLNLPASPRDEPAERGSSWQDAPIRDHGQTAAPFMRDEDRVGRNDPCPCGSGKKFKKCCMEKSQAPR